MTGMALNELGDHFSRLGGAARPLGMAEFEMSLYIICKLLELNKITLAERLLPDRAFLKAAKPVLEKVDERLEKVSLSEIELYPFLREFYDYVNQKLKPQDKTKRWEYLGEFLRDK